MTGFAPLVDAEAATWVRSERSAAPGSVGWLVPGEFERHVAIRHPMSVSVDAPLQWSVAADAAGMSLQNVRHTAGLVDKLADAKVSDLGLEHQRALISRARAGLLPQEYRAALIETLGGNAHDTTTVFAVWDGWAATPPDVREGTHVLFGSRGWFLCAAEAHMAVVGFRDGLLDFGLGPGMWWPRDRSRVVVSDTDLEISYVGCSARQADALLESEIECFTVDRDTPITW